MSPPIRRTLQAVDVEALDQRVSGWLAGRTERPGTPPGAARTMPRRVIAVDGKSARGARGPDRRPVHLLAALDHHSGVVLGQTVVDGKTNEITAFAPLCDRIDLTDALITADALHTQRAHAECLHARGAHYVLIVKGNHPGLHHSWPPCRGSRSSPVDTTRDKGHGRIESRTLKLTAVTAGIRFLHARLAIQLTPRRRSTASSHSHTKIIYAVTDLTWDQIRADQLAEAIRRHWHIENRLH